MSGSLFHAKKNLKTWRKEVALKQAAIFYDLVAK